MRDRFGRTIDYLRVSVTDRCNLRCRYCMPPEGVEPIRCADVMSYEEIAAFVREAAGLGVRKVRLTGGEPLVRKGVVTLVAMLAEIDGVEDLAMTTNGVLLGRFAADLRAAGLGRINVSLDAIDPDRYAEITRGGDVREALAGIEAARRAGLTPIKLNCVVERSSDEPDARDVAEFARRQHLAVRFVRRMRLHAGTFEPVEGGEGGRCECCNRLRLSSDGWLRPCLFSDHKVSVRELGGAEAIRRAVEAKPACGTVSQANQMHFVGG
jgi:cyclic pyranopterin phosphate synthase